jgi:hypothetical protein
MSRTILRGNGGVDTDLPFAGTDPILVPRDRLPDFSTGWITVTTEGTLPAGLNPIVHNLNTPAHCCPV